MKKIALVSVLFFALIFNLVATPAACDNYLKQLVVLIGGTSSSGKTSTINELKRLNPSLIIDGTDLVTLRSYPSFIKEFFPAEYAALSKVLPEASIDESIFNDAPEFLESSSSEDQERALSAIDSISNTSQKLVERLGSEEAVDQALDQFYINLLAEQTVQYLNTNEQVVLDVLNVESMRSALACREVHADIKNILLYLPMDKFVDRVNSRNAKAFADAQYIELREPLDMLTQYAILYEITPKQGPSSIQYISIGEAREVFEHALHHSIELYKKVDDLGGAIAVEANGAKIVEETLERLGFTDKLQSGYLTPRFEYDLMFDTSTATPEERAMQIYHQLFD